MNPGMDAEVFEQFIDQLRRYVRERLIPAEEAVIAADAIPADILQEMRDMGLFGQTGAAVIAVRRLGVSGRSRSHQAGESESRSTDDSECSRETAERGELIGHGRGSFRFVVQPF